MNRGIKNKKKLSVCCFHKLKVKINCVISTVPCYIRTGYTLEALQLCDNFAGISPKCPIHHNPIRFFQHAKKY